MTWVYENFEFDYFNDFKPYQKKSSYILIELDIIFKNVLRKLKIKHDFPKKIKFKIFVDPGHSRKEIRYILKELDLLFKNIPRK